jgi:hypothetical protein
MMRTEDELSKIANVEAAADHIAAVWHCEKPNFNDQT